MTTPDTLECAECKTLQPNDSEKSLHMESCSRHDELTCVACINISHGDAANSKEQQDET